MLKFYYSIIIILTVNTIFAQINEELWKYYIDESQLAQKKVKAFKVTNDLIREYEIFTNGKIKKITYTNLDGTPFGYDSFHYFGNDIIRSDGYRESNIHLSSYYEYENNKLKKREDFVNKNIIKYTEYEIDKDGWIVYMVNNRLENGYLEQSLDSRERIYYNEDGLIIASERWKNKSRTQTMYNYDNLDNKPELIEVVNIFYINGNDNPDNIIKLKIDCTQDGFPKRIQSEDYISEITYEYYSEEEHLRLEKTNYIMSIKINSVKSNVLQFLNRLENLNCNFLKAKINSDYKTIMNDIANELDSNQKEKKLDDFDNTINEYIKMTDSKIDRLNKKLAPWN